MSAFCGTPSFLLTIAEKAEEMGLDPRKDLDLRVGLVAAEMLPESLALHTGGEIRNDRPAELRHGGHRLPGI